MKLNLPLKHYNSIAFNVANNLQIIALSPENAKPFGFSTASVSNKKFPSFLVGSQKKQFASTINMLQTSNKKNTSLEVLVTLANGKQNWFAFYIEKPTAKAFLGNLIITVSNIHKTKTHQLQLQNTLHEKEQQLLALQEAYQLNDIIINNADAMIVSLDAKGKIVQFSKMAETITGYTKAEMMGKPPLAILLSQKKYPGLYAEIKSNINLGNINNIIETPISTKTGEEKIIRWKTTYSNIKNSKICSISVGRDITQLKKYKAELYAYENKFRLLFETLPLPIMNIESNGNVIFFNQAFTNMFGYDTTDIKTAQDLATSFYKTPKRIKAALADWKRRTSNLGEDFVMAAKREVTINCKDSNLKTIEILGTYNKYNAFYYYTDVTNKKIAEQLLIDSEARFRRIAENIPLPVSICNIEGKTVFLNKKAIEIIGYTIAEVPTVESFYQYLTDPVEQLAVKSRDEWDKLFGKFVGRKKVVFPTIERVIICKDGSQRHFEISFSAEENMLYAVYNDITLKVLTNNSLKQQREFYESILNKIPTDIVVFDEQHRYVFVNPVSIKDANLRQWIIGKTDKDYCKYRNKPLSIAEKRNKIFDSVISSKNLQSWEEQLQNEDGEMEYHLHNMYPVIDSGGLVKMIIGYGLDITERKKSEQLLLESEQRFKRIADNTPISICNFDREMNITYINKKFLDICGYTFRDIAKAQSWPHFIYYTDAENTKKGRTEWMEAIEKKWKYPSSKTPVLVRTIVCKNGEYKIFEISFTVHNKLVYAILNDVTEKKEAEKMLFESEQRFKALAENMPIAIASHDIDGRVIFLNKHFVNTIGYTNKDIPTLTEWYEKTQPDPEVRNIFYQHWLETVVAYRKGLLNTIPYIETPVRCKNGFARTFNFLFSIYKNNVYIILVDITKRKQAEQELINSHLQLRELASHLQKVREEERKNVAREIHDELGQLVTGLKMDISFTKKKVEKVMPELGERLTDIMALTDSIVHTVRRIASELRPSILDDIGLDAALEWQCREFQKRTNITCQFSNSARDIEVSVDVKSNLFRIFQESLTNIIRHANATKVMASLSINNQNLVLAIQDNGDGFSGISQNGTFGLLGMKERAIMINGIFKIESGVGKGTSITILVKL